MPALDGIRAAFRLALFRRTAKEVEDEFAFHLDMRASELMAEGWNADAARAEARRQFGNLDDARKYCRQTDERREKRTMRSELLSELRHDLAFAVRTLRKSPAFTVVAILTLALGIGANTAILSVVRGILLRPMAFTDPDRVMVVGAFVGGQRSTLSPANAYDWRDQNHSFTSMAILTSRSRVLNGAGAAEQLTGYEVGADFFSILGVKPVTGRLIFNPAEAAWQGPKTVLLNETLWRTRFGSNPNIVNSTISLDNEPYLVAGVVPAVSAWPSTAQVWYPFTYDPVTLPQSRGAVYLTMIGRLKSGTTVESANTDMRALTKKLETAYPDENTGVSAIVLPIREWITGSLRDPLFILLGGVGFVLLIACANVANLLLVRGVTRESELAVRTALGAGRGRLIRQLVTESMVLSFAGGFAGLAIAVIGTRALVASAPPSIPRLGDIHLDSTILLATLAITVVTGVIFGVIPALQLVRPNLAQTLREGGRSGGKRGPGNSARRALVIAEVALSVMLLAGAGLLIRSFDKLMRVDPGFRTDNAVSFALSLPKAKFDDDAQKKSFTTNLLTQLNAIPGVKSAGLVSRMPLSRGGFTISFTVTGHPPLKPADEPSGEIRLASPGLFAALGMKVVKGRPIQETDRAGAPTVMLITEAAARQFFKNEDPIGKHVVFGWNKDKTRLEGDIVGILADVKQSSLATEALPQFYIPFDQWPVYSYSIVLQSPREPQALINDARRIVNGLDPDLALSQVRTLEQVVAESVAQPRFYMTLLTVFAAIALILSAIGIYGVIAYLVGQRSREIGIRIALGASSAGVVRLVVVDGLIMVGIGLAVGLGGALALSRLMGSLLFNIAATDPLTYVAVTGVLALAGLAALCVPALRATRVDPALAMRAE